MTDIDWYYADHQQQQHGPLAASEIAALFRKQALGLDNLVWREGLSEWQPLAQHLEAFGLDPRELDAGHLLPPVMPPPAVASPGFERPAEVVPAGFARRFGAYVLDSLILSFVFYAVLIVLLVSAAELGSLGALDDNQPPGWVVGAFLLVIALYYVAAGCYYALQESGPHQATFGKRALGIKVTGMVGERLSFAHALGRWAAATLSYVSFYIGFLMAAITERKQALHDLVAGTLVVDRWAYTSTPEKQSSETSGCLVAGIIAAVALFLIFVAGIIAAISIPAYQDYTLRAGVAEALIAGASAKVATQEFIANTDRCPRDIEELGLPPPGSSHVRKLSLGENAGRCTLQIELAGVQGAYELDGKHLWLELQDNGEWQCSSDAPARYLPVSCR